MPVTSNDADFVMLLGIKALGETLAEVAPRFRLEDAALIMQPESDIYSLDVGTIYAAVRDTENNVFAAIINIYQGLDVSGYMSATVAFEMECPAQVDCPSAIMSMLTATTDKKAARWRSQAHSHAILKSAKITTIGNMAILAPT